MRRLPVVDNHHIFGMLTFDDLERQLGDATDRMADTVLMPTQLRSVLNRLPADQALVGSAGSR